MATFATDEEGIFESSSDDGFSAENKLGLRVQ
jgi:hypothetical protein